MKALIMLQIAFITNLYKAFVFLTMWNWFLIDITEYTMTFVFALGITYTHLLFARISMSDIREMEKESTHKEWIVLFLTMTVHYSYILGVGYIISKFI